MREPCASLLVYNSFSQPHILLLTESEGIH